MREYNFKTAKDLLSICDSEGISISEAMLRRESQLGGYSGQALMDKIDERLRVMERSTERAGEEPVASMGGLIGGQAKAVAEMPAEKSICGSTVHKAIVYALAVSEVNASMGLIVAAPTAGASGVIPGALLSVYEDNDLDVEALRRALACAGAIGYLITLNGSVSGAEAGCQAEVGAASAMAAAALTEMLGGTPEQCCHAASIAASNLLGLVCDPVRGLVEVPCQTRNTIGATGAITAAELALAGVTSPVPLDEMIQIVSDVGRTLPESLRETGKGGCAAAPSVCANCK